MSFKVGDLVPFGSGTSHLGVNGGTEDGSFVPGSLSPFGHIVMLSGVWLDPVLGQSGIIRYSKAGNAFETSVDGGLNFTAIGSDVTLSGVFGINGIDVQQVAGSFVVDGANVSGVNNINGVNGPSITLSGVNNVVITPSGGENFIAFDTALSRKGLKQGLELGYSDSGVFTVGPGRMHTIDSNGAHRIVENNDSLSVTMDPMISGWRYIYVNTPLATNDLIAGDVSTSLGFPVLNGTKRGYYNGDGRCIGAIRLEQFQIIPFQTDGNYFRFSASVFDQPIALNATSGVLDVSDANDGSAPVYAEFIEASMLSFTFAGIPNLYWYAGAGANVATPPSIDGNSGGLELGMIFSSSRADSSTSLLLPIIQGQATLVGTDNSSSLFEVHGHRIPSFIADTVG